MSNVPNDATVTMATDPDEQFQSPPNENRLVRIIKSITVNPEQGTSVDDRIVKFSYYNSFNYSLLSREHDNMNLTLGITSANPGEGKTLVACNFAVSLAMGSQKKTILVDLNILHPRLHEVFGVAAQPGLVEAFNSAEIHISRTTIDNLSVLTAGNYLSFQGDIHQRPLNNTNGSVHQSLRLDQLASFRDVIYSLEQEFEVIIIDMPSVNSEGVPVLFANQLNGLLVVVDSGKTRKEHIDSLFHVVNERQVLGFVFNHFSKSSA